MLSHKLSNLLKLYRTASRVQSINTIAHCSKEFEKILTKIDGRDVDPVTRLYLNDLKIIHQVSKDIIKNKMLDAKAA